MRIDFGQALCGFDGKPLWDGAAPNEGEEGKTIALATVCINALMADLESDRSAAGEEKVDRWHLAQRIFAANEAGEPLELKATDVVLIQDRVGKAFGAAIVAPAFALLDATE